jgi:hypothetical protein
MAPNRKNVASLELPIVSEALQFAVQAKFLPLTDSREQHEHEQQQQQQKTVQDSTSYWDWPADTQEEEKLDTLFSTSRIESNLIQDGKKYEETTGNQVARHDEYWAERSVPVVGDDREAVRSTKPQHEIDLYWSWPANRNLHMEEHAERLTTTSHVESNLRTFEEPNCFSSTTNKQHDDYWTWSSEPQRRQFPHSDTYWTWNTLTKLEEKQHLIQSILQYERARQLCSADHIEKRLVTTAKALKQDFAVPTIHSSGYWVW